MKQKLPSYTDLFYFVAIVKQLNLSKAAQALGVTQPSLTQAVNRLEERMGAALFSRAKSGLILTRAGKFLNARAQRLLQDWASISLDYEGMTSDVRGRYTLGCHPSVAIYILPKIMKTLLMNYPHLELNLVHDLSRHITDQVSELKIDIGISVNPLPRQDLVITPLCRDQISLWKSPQYQAHSEYGPDVFCDTSLLQTQIILKQLKSKQFNIHRVLSSMNLEVVAELTKAGVAYGILPGNVAKMYGLEKVVKSPFHADEVCLLYHGDNRHLKVIQVISEMIKKLFQSNDKANDFFL